MSLLERKKAIMDNLKDLVEGGRKIARIVEHGDIKSYCDNDFTITEFKDETVMRFKRDKTGGEK